MKFKKVFSLSLVVLALVSCKGNSNSNTNTGTNSNSNNTNSVVSTKPSEVTVTKKDSKLYLGSLLQSLNMPTFFFSDASDIPYVSIDDFFINGFNTVLDPSKENIGYKLDNNSIINKYNNASLVFDVENNTISSEDFDQFNSACTNLNDPTNLLSVVSDATAKYSDKTSYTKGNKVTFNLSKYGVSLKKYDGKIYVPFAFVETILDAASTMRFIFNGENYYFYSSPAALRNDDGTLTEYGTSLYAGSLLTDKKVSQSYANYIYNAFIFTLENFNGHYSKLNISSLDTKLKEVGLKDRICSTDPVTSNTAMAEVVNKYFNDGGHTAFLFSGINAEYNPDRDEQLSGEIKNYDTRLVESSQNDDELKKLRGVDTLTNHLDIEGETAIIRFDSFKMNQAGVTYSKDTISKDNTTTFAIIYNSFETIKQNSSIKNVVFDVTLNGGGQIPALGQALSFMTNDPVEVNVKDTLTGSFTKTCVKYDNDLDGDFDDDDSYEGKYNFYIMTSVSSYSCGNAFPIIAQEYGYAKVIGQTSGGGDCSTLSFVGADGTVWAMSSYKGFASKNNDKDFDLGATPDYTLDNSYFYDKTKLNNYLSTLNTK